MLTLSPLIVSRIDTRKDVHGRWTSLKTYSLLVLSAARKDKQDLVHQDGSSMPGAAAPGKYPVNTFVTGIILQSYHNIANAIISENVIADFIRLAKML